MKSIFPVLCLASLIIILTPGCETVNKSSDAMIQSINIDSLGHFGQGTLEKDLYYDYVLSNDPDNDEAWQGKSVSYLKRGNAQEGFRCLDRAVELNPLGQLGYRGWVKLYMFHDYDGALNDFYQLDSMTPNFQDAPWGENIDLLIGLCQLQNKQYDSAIQHLKRSIDVPAKQHGIDWVDQRAFLYLCIAYQRNGDFTNALKAIDQLLELAPNSPEAFMEKARLIGDRNPLEAEQLLDSCEKYISLKSYNPYFELPFEIYPSDISELNKKLGNEH